MTVDVVTELTETEFHAAARRTLAGIGLGYGELATMAREHRLPDARACSVWSCLGDLLPDDFA